MKEAPKLGITQEIVDRSPKQVFPFSEDSVSYMKIGLGKMQEEQESLFAFSAREIETLPSINNKFMFGLGTALTYDMIPQSHKIEPLTLEQVSAAHQSIAEHRIKDPKTNKEMLDLNWITGKLKKDSPPFVEWLGTMMNGIEKDQGRSTFLLGAVWVVTPFLMRAEAKEMEQRLFGKEGGDKS